MKSRANLTIGENLKRNASAYAASLEMDLSELVAHLLRDELANPTIGQKKHDQSAIPAFIEELPQRGSTAKREKTLSGRMTKLTPDQKRGIRNSISD